mmetsp:Transcript_14031/g.21902  ORF Transcript_14031/g.21902 Transcript_14031/m.21902 type:complete len:434 (+) Transcript_14031:149-1450(+)
MANRIFLLFGAVLCIAISFISSVKQLESIFPATTTTTKTATEIMSAITSHPPHLPPTLDELLSSTEPYSSTCPQGMTRINVSYIPRPPKSSATRNFMFSPPTAKSLIPNIIHMTSKSSCFTPDFVQNIHLWYRRFPGYKFYFHDENAVSRLLSLELSNSTFPGLHETAWCARGATKSDLWRYLVLWYYGGIYTDLDNSPTGFNPSSISSNDDAYVPLEGSGVPTQFFMASSPYHPLMNYTLSWALRALRGTVNVINNNPAINTGPRALKNGIIEFLNDSGIDSDGYFDRGGTLGGGGSFHNRNVTIAGSKGNPDEFINRVGISQGKKLQQYELMNMTHFHNWKSLTAVDKKTRIRVSCEQYIADVRKLLDQNQENNTNAPAMTTSMTQVKSSSRENSNNVPLPETLYDIINLGQWVREGQKGGHVVNKNTLGK